jgi:hypothetical protein
VLPRLCWLIGGFVPLRSRHTRDFSPSPSSREWPALLHAPALTYLDAQKVLQAWEGTAAPFREARDSQVRRGCSALRTLPLPSPGALSMLWTRMLMMWTSVALARFQSHGRPIIGTHISIPTGMRRTSLWSHRPEDSRRNEVKLDRSWNWNPLTVDPGIHSGGKNVTSLKCVRAYLSSGWSFSAWHYGHFEPTILCWRPSCALERN